MAKRPAALVICVVIDHLKKLKTRVETSAVSRDKV